MSENRSPLPAEASKADQFKGARFQSVIWTRDQGDMARQARQSADLLDPEPEPPEPPVDVAAEKQRIESKLNG